jgi:peptidoglycan biosynthesis protein MviN/MurJ (putative lipid II flippase)
VFYAYRDTTTPFYLGWSAAAADPGRHGTYGLVLKIGATGIALGYALSRTSSWP